MSYREKEKLEKLHQEYCQLENTTADLSLDPYFPKESGIQNAGKKSNSDSHLPYLP